MVRQKEMIEEHYHRLSRAKEEGREPRTYHGVFATHPRNDERFKEVVRAAEGLGEGESRANNRRAYLEMIDGMVFGDSDEIGVTRGDLYLHPVHGYALRIPDGWTFREQNARVTGASQGIGAHSPAMGQVLQDAKTLAYDLVALATLYVGDETNPTGVMLVRRVVQTLPLWQCAVTHLRPLYRK